MREFYTTHCVTEYASKREKKRGSCRRGEKTVLIWGKSVRIKGKTEPVVDPAGLGGLHVWQAPRPYPSEKTGRGGKKDASGLGGK